MIIQFGNPDQPTITVSCFPLKLTEYTQWIHWSISWRSTHLWLIGWFNLMEQFVFYPHDPWKGVDMIALFHQCSRLGFWLIMSSARTKDIPWWPFVNSGPLLFTGWVSSILTLISARDTTNHSDMRRHAQTSVGRTSFERLRIPTVYFSVCEVADVFAIAEVSSFILQCRIPK